MSYLQSNQKDLQGLLTKCKKLIEVNQHFLALLEEPLKSHCVVANTDRQRIIVLAANGSIATHLRLKTPELLRKFAAYPLLERFKEIECKVRPQPNQLKKETTKQPAIGPLKPEITKMIHEMAESIEDPKLKEVMQRFGKPKLPPK